MNNSNTLVILNPSAGKGKALQKKGRLEVYLQRFNIPYDLFITQSEEELRTLVREKAGTYRRIIGAGGDSTFNIIVNEILKTGTEIDFGMIGIGSSNDITKEFGLHTLESACRAIQKGRTRKIDLGSIVGNGIVLSYFLGQANIGLGVNVNRYVEELSIQGRGRARSQMLAGIAGVIKTHRSGKIPVYLLIETDAGPIAEMFHVALFSNIRFWATGLNMCPAALPDDGLLDSCLIRQCSLGRLVKIAFQARKGRHIRVESVETLQSKEFTVSADDDFHIQTDGEILGGYSHPTGFRKVSFRTVPKVLNLIC